MLAHQHAPTFWEAMRFWLKLGFISFGGPAGQIAIVHQELVEKKHWISEQKFLHALNYCMILPGPEALQLVIYMGWILHRTLGGLIAGLLFILPALLLLILFAILYVLFGQTPMMTAIFFGIKPAVTAIVLATGYRISKKILKKPFYIFLALSAFLAMQLHLPYPVIIVSAGLLGYLMHRYQPLLLSNSQSHDNTDPSSPASPPDEASRLAFASLAPPHTRFNRQQFLLIIGISLLAFAIPYTAIFWMFGQTHVFTQLAWFFTKVALLTFGGAYAVLPYVFQAGVENFQWLTAAQMMDGLALGESTPGPLIIVVTFVGFMAAYAGTLIFDSPMLTGVIGALIVSWFVFLPSFCFIFLGAPFIESTRAIKPLTAALDGITCAVVGVIATMALFFAWHTLFPDNLAPTVQTQHVILSTLLMFFASVALIRFGQSVVRVLLACALLGTLLHMSF